MSELCCFLGPLEECEFRKRAGFGDHINKALHNPGNIGGNPNASIERTRKIGGVRLHDLVCSSKLYVEFDQKIEKQKSCDAYNS